MPSINALTSKITENFEQLSMRERLMVGACGAVLIVFICFISWFTLSRKVELAQTRIHAKTTQLSQLMDLQSTFSRRELEGKQLQNKLKNNKVRLISHLESAAKAAGVEIGNMTPHDSNPDSDGIIETTVTIKLQRLSLTRLQEFLSRVENSSQSMIFVKRLRVNKRFDDKTLLDAEMAISTYKIN